MKTAPSRSLVVAAAAFAIALFVFGSALVGALASEGVTADGAALPVPTPTSEGGAVEPLSMDALMLAVESDPFRPERARVAERYRLPGDVDPEPPPAPPPPPPPPDFRLGGTAVSPTGGAALIQVGDAPPHFLAVGESMLGYRLDRVTALSATMVNEEGEITLQIPAPQQRVAAAPQQGGRNGRGPAGRTGQNNRESAALQRLLERARESGASPQMLESIMRAVERNGIGSIDNMEVGPNGFTIRSARTPAPPPPPDTAMVPARRSPDPY